MAETARGEQACARPLAHGGDALGVRHFVTRADARVDVVLDDAVRLERELADPNRRRVGN